MEYTCLESTHKDFARTLMNTAWLLHTKQEKIAVSTARL